MSIYIYRCWKYRVSHLMWVGPVCNGELVTRSREVGVFNILYNNNYYYNYSGIYLQCS